MFTLCLLLDGYCCYGLFTYCFGLLLLLLVLVFDYVLLFVLVFVYFGVYLLVFVCLLCLCTLRFVGFVMLSTCWVAYGVVFAVCYLVFAFVLVFADWLL